MFCQHCGAGYDENMGMKFCMKCGKPIELVVTADTVTLANEVEPSKKKKNMFGILAVVVAVIAIVGLGIWAFRTFVMDNRTDIEKIYDALKETLKSDNFTFKIKQESKDEDYNRDSENKGKFFIVNGEERFDFYNEDDKAVYITVPGVYYRIIEGDSSYYDYEADGEYYCFYGTSQSDRVYLDNYAYDFYDAIINDKNVFTIYDEFESAYNSYMRVKYDDVERYIPLDITDKEYKKLREEIFKGLTDKDVVNKVLKLEKSEDGDSTKYTMKPDLEELSEFLLSVCEKSINEDAYEKFEEGLSKLSKNSDKINVTIEITVSDNKITRFYMKFKNSKSNSSYNCEIKISDINETKEPSKYKKLIKVLDECKDYVNNKE